MELNSNKLETECNIMKLHKFALKPFYLTENSTPYTYTSSSHNSNSVGAIKFESTETALPNDQKSIECRFTELLSAQSAPISVCSFTPIDHGLVGIDTRFNKVSAIMEARTGLPNMVIYLSIFAAHNRMWAPPSSG